MGTEGYWSYRHNGWFFREYCSSDAYPDSLGLNTLRLVPRRSAEFAAWLARKRIELDCEFSREHESKGDQEGEDQDDEEGDEEGDGGGEKYEEEDEEDEDEEEDEEDEEDEEEESEDGQSDEASGNEYLGEYATFCITRQQPFSGCEWLELLDWDHWAYEVDLDNLVFWVNGAPFFRLDKLPPPNIFLKIDSHPNPRDRYGHYAPSLRTPTKYVASHVIIPAPAVPASALEAYAGLSTIEIPVVPIHDLLGLQARPTASETIRIRLLEVLAAHLMIGDEPFGWIPRVMRAHRNVACGKKQAPSEAYTAYKAFVAAIVHPPHLFPHGKDLYLTCDMNWPRPDVCLLLAFHLDDEPNLRASIVQLVKVVQEARQSSKVSIAQQVIYGVLFDVWVCCIVKIHPDGHVMAHMGCLQFLPDYRLAENPYKPGITAIGRLFCRPGA